MNCKIEDTEKDTTVADVAYKHCLNCGAELKGTYCHECGQQATSATPTIKSVIMEYVYNAFIWDPKSLRTLWLLMRKPGLLTKEFIAGRYVSYVHPLKLNMFILFVFVTLFLSFSGTEKVSISSHDITEDELTFPSVQMELITSDEEYSVSVINSPRDTIQLSAPLLLAETYPEIFTNLETTEDTHGQSLDKWTTLIPHRLIEDSVVVPGADGYYIFNTECEVMANDLRILYMVWDGLVKFITRYFPIIILLTVPFLSFSLRLVQRKHKETRINRFVFSLHYTAFLELFIIFIYILYLVAAPPIAILQWVLIAASCAYLTMAFRQVYGTTSWGKAIIKSIYTTLVYLLIILLAFAFIFLVTVFVVVFQTL